VIGTLVIQVVFHHANVDGIHNNTRPVKNQVNLILSL
jgi:hypothetical protein